MNIQTKNEKRKKKKHQMTNDKNTSNYTHESMLQTEDSKNTNLWVQMYIFL